MKSIFQTDKNAVQLATEVLTSGGVIVYPTDTLYGLGANATNDSAIDRINLIKGRTGPLSVMAPNLGTALKWLDVNAEHIRLVEPFLGGAKTLIAPVQPNIVSAKILGITNSLGIRIPNNIFCNELSANFGKPIISTSVNRSGEEPLNNPELIEETFGSQIDLLIDGGTLPKTGGSTIYQLKDNNIIILRK